MRPLVRGHRGAGRNAGDRDAECLGAIGVGQRRLKVQRDRRILVARGVLDSDGRAIRHAGDGDAERGDLGRGVSTIRLGRGGGDGQSEVGVGVGRRRDLQVGELGRSQGPSAVAVVGAGRERRPVRNARDRDCGDRLRAIGVRQRGADIQRDRRVFIAGGGRNSDRRCVGHAVDGDGQVDLSRGRGGAALGGGCCHLQGEVGVGIRGWRDLQVGQLRGGQGPGAIAVVEGTGDHGCEYMTGGTVVALGLTGRNFAAGMSGGIAYVYDEDGLFAKRCNTSMATLEPVLTQAEQQAKLPKSEWHAPVNVKEGGERLTDEVILKNLIERHFKHTGSERAKAILADWEKSRARFVKVFPTEYKRALGELWEKSQGSKQAASV